MLAALDEVPSVNPSALLTYFTFGYVSGADAIFRGMHRLDPGTALTIDARSGSATVERFWTWPDGSVADTRREAKVIEELRAELDEAVRIRMRSDVPLGAFLSGGMDSAAVLALMTRHSSRPVQTFTIGFGDPAYDELDEARSTAAAFGADHHEQIVTPDGVTGRRCAGPALRRAVCRRVGHSHLLRVGTGAASRHRVPVGRRRRRAVCGIHAVCRRARPCRGARRRAAALRRSAPAPGWCRSTRGARDGSARWALAPKAGSCGDAPCFPTIFSRRSPSPT